MPEIELSFSDFERVYADLPPAPLVNRFFEENPFQGRKRAALARPATTVLGNYGTGPMRKFYAKPGIFDGDLFFVSGSTLYRRQSDGTTFAISGTIQGTSEVSMCVARGLDYQRLFIADGLRLQFYAGGSQASGDIVLSANVSNGDTVQIGTTYFTWNDTVTDGAGTAASPFVVLRGASAADSLTNLVSAISFTGTSGVTYSSTLGGQSTLVTAAVNSAGTTVTITSISDTASGNTIVLTDTVDGGGVITTPGTGLLSGGNTHALSGVNVPDGLPPSYIGTLKGYVLVAIGRTDRFYWIDPGEVTINALDFATAESQPDKLVSLQIMGDTAWFIGQESTEVWYPTGDPDLPFNPVSGRTYDRGALEGTVVNIKGVLYLVDQDYSVYAISGSPQRVSNHGIEETIRKQVASEA